MHHPMPDCLDVGGVGCDGTERAQDLLATSPARRPRFDVMDEHVRGAGLDIGERSLDGTGPRVDRDHAQAQGS